MANGSRLFAISHWGPLAVDILLNLTQNPLIAHKMEGLVSFAYKSEYIAQQLLHQNLAPPQHPARVISFPPTISFRI